MLYGTFSLKFFETLSTELLSYYKAAQFQFHIHLSSRQNKTKHTQI